MFVGHFAVGFASKRLAPKASLGVLLLAPLLLDVLWPPLLLLGIEHVRIEPGATRVSPLDLYDYPYSHSLLMTLVWSALFAGVYFVFTRDRRTAAVLAAGVSSHWLFDFVTHRPDMPILPGSSLRVGLGLWDSVVGTALIEGSFFVASVILYTRCTRAKDRTGSYAFWAYVGLLSILYASSLSGEPPPSVAVLIVVGFVSWLFLPWAMWFDRHRQVVSGAEPSQSQEARPKLSR